MEKYIHIYTDGSSIGNPGPGGWGAILWYPGGEVRELGGREDHTTNNRMELVGAIESLEYSFTAALPVRLYTDSAYLINGITKWVHGWQKNGWVTKSREPVLNKELWETLFAIAKKMQVEWRHTPGHAGIAGNERVDEIANGLARGFKITLYHGDMGEYGRDLSLPAQYEKPAGTISRSPKNPTYVSVVDGKVVRHTTWGECQKRVTGIRGAKFKKVFSAAEEERVLKAWGIAV